MVKVIASSLRKGNVVEQDGNLHVILTAENVHPGKGNSIESAMPSWVIRCTFMPSDK